LHESRPSRPWLIFDVRRRKRRMNYASFLQRFVAMWIDFFVLLPLMALQIALGALSSGVAAALVIPVSLSFVAYSIYCHGRYGQTLGKRLVGVRVVRTTGQRIGWREAWLRSSVDTLFSVLGIIGSFVALATITEAEYLGGDWLQRAVNFGVHQPSWVGWVDIAAQVWIWSEVIVMLFNPHRRALHDFIAGTIVVSEVRAPDPQPQSA
jgi:uncharacterized RDD family membrane protein YckC